MIDQTILKLIERRSRFEGEIRDVFRDESPEAIDAALGRLRAFLDDRQTLTAYLRAHEGRHTLGRERMREELARRFAPPELVETAFADLPSETERAVELMDAERKARSRAQAGRFLSSRGFDEEAVEGAIERLFGGGDASEAM